MDKKKRKKKEKIKVQKFITEKIIATLVDIYYRTHWAELTFTEGQVV